MVDAFRRRDEHHVLAVANTCNEEAQLADPKEQPELQEHVQGRRQRPPIYKEPHDTG